MPVNGQDSLPDVRKWSKGYSDGPGVVRRPYRMSGSGRESLRDVQEWSGDTPGCP